LQQARDEAHRFAVTFQRKRRAVRTVTSALMTIPGVGPTKRRQLLQAFGSIQGVREATPEQIGALPGWSAASARKVLDALEAASPTRPAPAEPSPSSAQETVPEMEQLIEMHDDIEIDLASHDGVADEPARVLDLELEQETERG
jgi:excinuclease ABC subunit C